MWTIRVLEYIKIRFELIMGAWKTFDCGKLPLIFAPEYLSLYDKL